MKASHLHPVKHGASWRTKPQIQALERTAPVLPMIPGVPERRSFDYVRHGTIDLFAALNIATGTVIGKLSAQHWAIDFRDFLDQIDRQTDPGLAVHVICDNLSTHKAPAVHRWLTAHPRFVLHFTPTYSSWINQVERWLAELQRRCLERGVFCSLDELTHALEDWIKLWNEGARPFKWTKTADQIIDRVCRYCARVRTGTLGPNGRAARRHSAFLCGCTVSGCEFEYTFSMQLRYNYRLDPRPRHRLALGKAFGCARVVFNDALTAREAAHQAGEPYLTDGQLSARLTATKATPERAWLGEVSAVVLQQALQDLNTAYRNFFASLHDTRKGPKMGKPRFRSRKDHRQAIRFTANARFKVLSNGKLRLPKIGDVTVRWSRPLPSEPSSVTVIKDAAGRYFASFVIETEPGALPEAEHMVGIDLGLRHFAVLSDGRKVTAPQFLRRAEKLLKRRQRELSRKQKGSRNRDKARRKVARAHVRVADARRDFHHQLSTALIRDNQAVAVEDLAVNGLGRTRLAKSVHDAGWAGFVAMLEYKARLYGREFCRIGRFEPTSQTCSACEVKDGPKPLHVREWQCRSCGAWLDRDINAAVNVAKAAGLAVTACRAQVRPEPVPAQRGEAGTHPKSHGKAA